MKRKLILSSIILIMTLIISNASFAAVEIIPSKSGDGKDAIVNTTVSNSYLLCQGMKDTGGTLKGTSVKPHLATNKDWGAVSYLSNSIYGTNTQGGNNGVQVTINGVNYYSTTTNITGVMNWGSNPNNKYIYTQTAALIKAYTDLEDSSTSSAYYNVTELENAAKNNLNYVEVISTNNRGGFNESIRGMALSEINTYSFIQWKKANNDTRYPISIRNGLFDYIIGAYSYTPSGSRSYDGINSGESSLYATFRPVVWN